MSLFERSHPVIALNDRQIDLIKQELASVLDVAASYDDTIARMGTLSIGLEGRMRGDLLAFTLHLSHVDKNTDAREIGIVNQLFDTNLTHEDFVLFRREVGNRSFERAVPASILILKELGTRLQSDNTRAAGSTATDVARKSGITDMSQALCDALINVYALIGSALTSADGVMTQRESSDLIRYLYLMADAVGGAGAPLPTGAAQRVLDAHRRLFGKLPKR